MGLPPPRDLDAREAIAGIVGVALITNPVAQLLLARGEGCRCRPFDTQRLVPRVADWIRRFHPDADLGVLLDAERSRAALTAEQLTIGDDGTSPSETWKIVLWAMYLKLFDPPSLEEAREDRLVAAVLDGLGVAAAVFGLEDRDPREPPEERLVQDVRGVVLKTLVTFHDVPLEEVAEEPQGTAWRH